MKAEEDLILKDKIYGCMVGGAVGDALGYPVEFFSRQQILSRYGEPGITRYELDRNGLAEISDDTQMSLFTAAGCLLGMTRMCCRGIMGALHFYNTFTYQNWLYTQTHSFKEDLNGTNVDTWLMRVPGLYARRAPGNTCLSAISDMQKGLEPQNDSCGCGGVMRVAPIPLICFRHHYGDVEGMAAAVEAAEAARLTHKHPLGFLPAAALSLILSRLLERTGIDGAVEFACNSLEKLVSEHDGDRTYLELWPKDVKKLQDILTCAVRMGMSRCGADAECIGQLGQGWTGHEALAIAVYCAARHADSFEDAVVAAVNHDGDSDSTGAICGNIMGLIHGRNRIPECYTEHLELLDVIEDIADDLYEGCSIGEYCDMDSPEKFRWFYLYTEHFGWEPKKQMLARIKNGSFFREHGMDPEPILKQFK